MWVKICGITSEEDALLAVALGADAVGFVFAPSPRQVTVGLARDICKRLPPDVLTVGVFRDQSPGQVLDAVLDARLGAAQLHGHETSADAAEIRPHVKVLIVAFPAGSSSISHYDDYHADALLLDAPDPGGGRVFDWSLAEEVPSNRRLILAGGLTPSNVAGAIAQVGPWGVDVSSGVEDQPGRKDPLLVRDFIRNAKAASRPVDPPDVEPSLSDLPFDWEDTAELN